MSSKEVQKKWIEGSGSGLPLRESTLKLPFVQRHPAFAPAIHGTRRGWFQPGFSNWIEVQEALLIALTDAAAGRTTVEEALDRAQKKALSIHPQGNINPGQPTRNQLWTRE
jgi:ABC-type glycerol-3-phosphate transport system substrate-binding protein